MTRWDRPLFTVLHDDAAPPCDAIWQALVGRDGEAKTVKPHQATILVRETIFPPPLLPPSPLLPPKFF